MRDLPPEFLQYLYEVYKPQGKVPGDWREVLPFVEAILARSAVTGLESLRKHVTHLLYFGLWARQQGLPLEATSFRRATIDEHCRLGMPGSTHKSTSDRRSRLRAIADKMHPEQAPVQAVSIPREGLKPPYDPAEMQGIRRVSGVQPTNELIRQVSLCVGLGAGAGIDSPDLRLLHRRDLEDHGDDGILVKVPGDRAREVWVLREYEPIVRRGLQGLNDGDLLIGKVQDRRNVAANVYNRATFAGKVPTPEQSRLRTTWLATLMTRPVPLAVILQAAGLRSTRTLFDLLPRLPATSDSSALRQDGAQ